MMTTEQIGEHWLRIAAAGGAARLDDLYDSVGPHRQAIAEALQRLKPVDSLVEIGCGAGNNLAMAETLGIPVRLGIDLDPCAVAYAASRVPCLGFVGDLRVALRALASKSWDVALSCYTLAYIVPGDLAAVLDELVRVTRRALILAEPQADVPHLDDTATPPVWVHNYQAAASALSFSSLHVKGVPDPVDGLDVVSVWRIA